MLSVMKIMTTLRTILSLGNEYREILNVLLSLELKGKTLNSSAKERSMNEFKGKNLNHNLAEYAKHQAECIS